MPRFSINDLPPEAQERAIRQSEIDAIDDEEMQREFDSKFSGGNSARDPATKAEWDELDKRVNTKPSPTTNADEEFKKWDRKNAHKIRAENVKMTKKQREDEFDKKMEGWKRQDKIWHGAQEVKERQIKRDEAEEKKARAEALAKPKAPGRLKKMGNIVVGITKEIVSDGSGRSGKRASKAYRQANREYKSEARKLRSEVTSPGSFSSKMLFGVDKTPVRTRYVGSREFAGSTDPLSNFSSGILGLQSVQQDTTIEAMNIREQRKSRGYKAGNNTRVVEKSPGSQLANFSKSLWRMKF